MDIKKWWSQLQGWQKGGIISFLFALFSILITIIVCGYSSAQGEGIEGLACILPILPSFLITSSISFFSEGINIFYVMVIITLISYTAIGALIGLFIERWKTRLKK